MPSTGGDLAIFTALQKPFKMPVPLSRSLPGLDAELSLGSSHGRPRYPHLLRLGDNLAFQLGAAAQHVGETFCRLTHRIASSSVMPLAARSLALIEVSPVQRKTPALISSKRIAREREPGGARGACRAACRKAAFLRTAEGLARPFPMARVEMAIRECLRSMINERERSAVHSTNSLGSLKLTRSVRGAALND
jgi:hypothetical protein